MEGFSSNVTPKKLISLWHSRTDWQLISIPLTPVYLVQILLTHIAILWMQCHLVPWCNTHLGDVVWSDLAQLHLAFVTWQLIPLSCSVKSGWYVLQRAFTCCTYIPFFLWLVKVKLILEAFTTPVGKILVWRAIFHVSLAYSSWNTMKGLISCGNIGRKEQWKWPSELITWFRRKQSGLFCQLSANKISSLLLPISRKFYLHNFCADCSVCLFVC